MTPQGQRQVNTANVEPTPPMSRQVRRQNERRMAKAAKRHMNETVMRKNRKR